MPKIMVKYRKHSKMIWYENKVAGLGSRCVSRVINPASCAYTDEFCFIEIQGMATPLKRNAYPTVDLICKQDVI